MASEKKNPLAKRDNGERDHRGRFLKGGPGGPGGDRSGVRIWRERMMETVGEKDFVAIVRKVVQAAKDGDLEAAKFLLPYLCGRPAQPVELEGAAIGNIQIVIERDPGSDENGALEAPAQAGSLPVLESA